MSGRHDLAVAERRKTQAVALAAQGLPYDEIARTVGFANRGTAWRTVQKALKEHTADAVEDLRARELERLDTLQASLWPRALEGDTRAVNAVLRVIESRIRLLGLARVAEPGPMKGPVVDPRYASGCLPGCLTEETALEDTSEPAYGTVVIGA